MATVNVSGGGADGWLREVEAAINGSAATQAMNEAQRSRDSKKRAEGENQPVGVMDPLVLKLIMKQPSNGGMGGIY